MVSRHCCTLLYIWDLHCARIRAVRRLLGLLVLLPDFDRCQDLARLDRLEIDMVEENLIVVASCPALDRRHRSSVGCAAAVSVAGRVGLSGTIPQAGEDVPDEWPDVRQVGDVSGRAGFADVPQHVAGAVVVGVVVGFGQDGHDQDRDT